MKKIFALLSLVIISCSSALAINIPGLKPKGTLKVGTIQSNLLVAIAGSLESPVSLGASGASVGDGDGSATILTISFSADAPLTAGAVYDIGTFGTTEQPVGVTFAATKASRGGSTTLTVGADTVLTGTVKVVKVTNSSVTVQLKAKATSLTQIKTQGDESTETTVTKSTNILGQVKFTVN